MQQVSLHETEVRLQVTTEYNREKTKAFKY